MDSNYLWTVRQKLDDLGFQFLGEVLQLRTKARLQPLSSPDQPRAERRKAGAATLFPFDQRRFEKRRPFLDEIPSVPVRHAFTFGGVTDLSSDADLVQKIQKDP